MNHKSQMLTFKPKPPCVFGYTIFKWCVPSLSRFLLPSISTNVMLQTIHIVACLESNEEELDPFQMSTQLVGQISYFLLLPFKWSKTMLKGYSNVYWPFSLGMPPFFLLHPWPLLTIHLFMCLSFLQQGFCSLLQDFVLAKMHIEEAHSIGPMLEIIDPTIPQVIPFLARYTRHHVSLVFLALIFHKQVVPTQAPQVVSLAFFEFLPRIQKVSQIRKGFKNMFFYHQAKQNDILQIYKIFPILSFIIFVQVC